MQKISKTPNQLSGHLNLYAIPLYNLISILGEVITVANNNLNFQIEFNSESINYSSTVEDDKHGKSFKHIISGDIEGRQPQFDKLLETMLNYKFIVVLQNADGNYSRIGDLSHALKFSFEYKTSPNPAGNKGYSVEFSGNSLTGQKSCNFPFIEK